MIINNFEQIKNLLIFETDDYFYHLQILKRKKDCEEHEKKGNNNARCIKTYYITSIEELDSKKNEIIALCEMFTARAYINLNAKSFEKVAYELNVQSAIKLQRGEIKFLHRLYDTIVGGGYDEEEKDENGNIKLNSAYGTNIKVNIGRKSWIVDWDEKEIPNKLLMEIELCKPILSPIFNKDYNTFIGQSKIIATIPTLNGWHIITTPFNLSQIEPYRCKNPFDVQKNNPTLLYFNKK